MKKNVLKNTIMLYGMTIAKMVIPLLTLPYLTRVLSTECYGAVSYLKAVVGYMQLIIDFGFVTSGTKDIVKVREDKKKLGQVAGEIVAARLMLSAAALAVLVVLMFSLPLLKQYKLYALLAFAVIVASIFLHDHLFRGLEKMHVVTVRFIVMKGLAAALTFVFVRSDADVLWIPILDLLGSAVAVLLVYIQIKKLDITIRLGNLKTTLQRLKSSALYFITNVANTMFNMFNTVVIGAVLPAEEVAFWSISLQMMTTIQSMYSPMIDGIYPEMVKSRELKQIRKLLRIFMPIILAGCVFSWVVAKYVLFLLGGTEYEAATPIFRCLIPVLTLSFPATLYGWPVLGAIGREAKVTETMFISAAVQCFGVVLLLVLDHFTLMSVAVLRCVTEFTLFATRAFYCRKYRSEFVDMRG